MKNELIDEIRRKGLDVADMGGSGMVYLKSGYRFVVDDHDLMASFEDIPRDTEQWQNWLAENDMSSNPYEAMLEAEKAEEILSEINYFL